jgi:putative ABC transport system permease protein
MNLNCIFRIIRRDPLSLVTHITGLSFGPATAILLIVFVRYELSFDRHFSNSESIYRFNSIWTGDEMTQVLPINLRAAYTEIPPQVAGVEQAVQIYRGGNVEVHHGNERFKDIRLFSYSFIL